MGSNTKIEWAHHTFNPWIGCEKVSDGCKFCYAEQMDHRFGGKRWGRYGRRTRTSEAYWKQPLKWNAKAEKEGVRYRVFCASMADVFELDPDVTDWRKELFQIIEATPNLDWLLLTKRPQFISILTPEHWDDVNWPHNVWVGTSVENQEAANSRIHHLLKVPAPVRFLSVEPMLGPVDLNDLETPIDSHIWMYPGIGTYELANTPDDQFYGRGVDWVICGGESGAKARPLNASWVWKLKEQCSLANVPFFFKQWGEWMPQMPVRLDEIPQGKKVHVFEAHSDWSADNRDWSIRVGKKEAGRMFLLRFFNEVPKGGNE